MNKKKMQKIESHGWLSKEEEEDVENIGDSVQEKDGIEEVNANDERVSDRRAMKLLL